MALVFEVRKDINTSCFDAAMISELLSNLSIVYDEVFVWSVDLHLAIWVVGSDAAFLAKTFASYRNDYERVSLQEGMSAQQLFKRIAEGKKWVDVSAMKKMETQQCAFDLANEANSIGPTLFGFITGSLSFLRSHAVIFGLRNSWSYAVSREVASERASIVHIKSKETFYRFCAN